MSLGFPKIMATFLGSEYCTNMKKTTMHVLLKRMTMLVWLVFVDMANSLTNVKAKIAGSGVNLDDDVYTQFYIIRAMIVVLNLFATRENRDIEHHHHDSFKLARLLSAPGGEKELD